MKILAIDGNSILNRAYYGIRPLTTKDGVHTNAIYGFLNILLKLMREHSPESIIIAFDVSKKTFRNEQFEDYKANRKSMPSELAMQLPFIKNILSYMGFNILFREGYEGDDILGTIAKLATKSNNELIISTGDRDCLQLADEFVTISLAKTKETILFTPEKVVEVYDIQPTQIIELKALMGDSSDNIPGVKGIGEKTALSLIKEYKTLDGIYENIDNIKATPRIKQLLIDGKDIAYLSRLLGTIYKDVPIEIDINAYKNNPVDEDNLNKILTRLEMNSFIQKLNIGGENADKTIIEAILISENSIANFCDELRLVDNIYLLLLENTIQIKLNKNIYIFTTDIDNILEKIIQSDKPIFTFAAKKIYKYCFLNSIKCLNLRFDIKLAAYLLNPDTKKYTMDDLINGYLPNYKLDISEEYYPIGLMSDLVNEMIKRLKEDKMFELYYKIELPLCEVLASMEYEGFGIDKKSVEDFHIKLEEDIKKTTEKIYELAGTNFNIKSTKELGVVLFETLGLKSTKKTKTGYSTDIDVLENLIDKHQIIKEIIEYRQLTKLDSTYVVGLLKVINDDGRVHSTFNQTETRTGRISSTEPNIQNIPIRTNRGSEIRKFFIARDGYSLVDADYSQIELRILAHIAKDKTMIEGFLNNHDIHSITASQVFNIPLDELPSEFRSRAKAINFGIVYGISPFSLAKDIGVTVPEAKSYMDEYFKTYSGVFQYMDDIIKQATKDEFVTTIYGRKRNLKDINSSNKNIKAFAQRIALNTPIQGTAADIIKIAMIKIYNRIKKENLDARLILQVHDELIIEAPSIQCESVKAILKEEMEKAADLLVPLVADVNSGKNWYIAKG